MKKKPASDFLFARPRALFGVARFFDFAASFDSYNSSESNDEADAKAMYSDWAVVGDAIETSMEKTNIELNSSKKAA
jgi:hypothetical protein